MTALAIPVAKGRAAPTAHARWLHQSNHRVATRSTVMARRIETALRRYGMRELRRIAASPFHPHVGRTVVVAKGDIEDSLRDELEAIFRKFGLWQIDDAGRRAAGSVGGHWIIPPGLVDEATADVARKVVLLVDGTRQATQESLREIVAESLGELPRPSSQEVARRIARSWFGPATEVDLGRGTANEERMTARWQRRDEGGVQPDEQEFLFSPERATLIARTELAMADNTGIAAGFTEAGVEFVKWLAHFDDGRSGNRQHYLMNQHPAITVAAMNSGDQSGWFTLPSGAAAPYPGWSGLPIGDLANCRCILVPS